MMGALIITVVLMGSIFLGFMSSVDKVPTTDVSYSYVTDGASLFSYTQSPEYVDYSPNVNYTHYTTDLDTAESASASAFYTTGVAYTEAEKVNQYRVFEAADTVTTDIDLSTMTFSSYVDQGNEDHLVPLEPYWIMVNNAEVYQSYYGYVTGANIVALQSVINSNSTFSQSNTTTLFTCDKSTWVMYGSALKWLNTRWGNYYNYEYIAHDDGVMGAQYVKYTVLYNPSSKEATVYRGTDGYAMYTGSPANILLVYGGTWHSNPGSDTTRPTGVMSAVTSTIKDPTYMDVSDGVTLTSSSVYWSNGYKLGTVDILLKAPNSTTTLTIKSSAGDTLTSVTYNTGYGYKLGTATLGKWDAALLSLDMRAGTATLTGVSSPTSMVDYSAASYSVSSTFAASETTRILQLSGLNWTVSVNKTSVFMDSYSNLMQDPSVNLSDYFASSEYLRLNFDSFAVYGNSITINGTTYDVTDGRISVEVDKRMRSFDLTNMFITWDKDGHVYLTFKNSSAEIDLGETSSKSLSLAGSWYFNAAIYEGVEETGYSYELSPGEWGLTENAFILIFIGLLILAAMIIHATKGLGVLDCVILAMAGLIGFVLLS